MCDPLFEICEHSLKVRSYISNCVAAYFVNIVRIKYATVVRKHLVVFFKHVATYFSLRQVPRRETAYFVNIL